MRIERIFAAIDTLDTALEAAGISHHIAVAIDEPKWAEFTRASSAYLSSIGVEVPKTTSHPLTTRKASFYCWRSALDPIERQIRQLQDLAKDLAKIRQNRRSAKRATSKTAGVKMKRRQRTGPRAKTMLWSWDEIINKSLEVKQEAYLLTLQELQKAVPDEFLDSDIAAVDALNGVLLPLGLQATEDAGIVTVTRPPKE